MFSLFKKFLSALLYAVPATILFFASPGFARADNTVSILFISSQTTTPYLNFIEKVKLELQADERLHADITALPAGRLAREHSNGINHTYDLVVALGKHAAETTPQWMPEAPVLYALIPEVTYKHLKETGKLACPDNQCTAVFIDQPLQRIFHVLTTAFGQQRRLGALLGPASSWQQDSLVTLARNTGVSLHTASIQNQDELLPALSNLLKQSDVLLSIADPVVYNRQTAKSILLTTYRHRVPLVAYSKAYADAGAALSIFSTPGQIARQTAGIIKTFFNNSPSELPRPQHPKHYSIRINQRVADSLDLELEANPELRSLINEAGNE